MAGTVNEVTNLLMLSDLSLSFVNHSNNRSALLSIDYVGSQPEKFLAIIKHSLPFGAFLVLISPEVFRFFECLYFVILRQNRRWSLKNILIFSIIEGIDAVLVALLVFKCASKISALQFASFGYQTVLPIALLKTIRHPRQPTGSNVSCARLRVLCSLGAILHLGGFGTLVWSLVDSYNKG